MSKIRLWWRRLFFGHEERQLFIDAIEARKKYCQMLKKESIFIHASMEAMLRDDIPRHMILDVLRTGVSEEDRIAIDLEILKLSKGETLPTLQPCPIIDFPMIMEMDSNEEQPNPRKG